jgi:hypothetical protein
MLFLEHALMALVVYEPLLPLNPLLPSLLLAPLLPLLAADRLLTIPGAVASAQKMTPTRHATLSGANSDVIWCK